jgi:hypothetical protein
MNMRPQSLEVPKIKIKIRKTFFSYFYFYNFKWLWRVKRLFLSELWIDLYVKRMIICFFMKAIICFLISLTFRWTLNHIFTKKACQNLTLWTFIIYIRKCTKKSCPLRHKWLHQQNTRMRDKHVNITWVADIRTTEEDKQSRYDV